MTYPGDQPSSDTAGFTPGTVIAGKYVVDRVLGKGGMGLVVAAQHIQLREPVALKFLRADKAQNKSLVTRFEREARAAVRIKSEHVARVIDVGTLDDGAPYIVMELLAGSDLHKHSAARGPLPWNEAALYIAQACDAVAEGHLYGIIHRDLKPANLFLTRRADGSPLVKVLDFGISKVAGEEDENLTATTDVLGSPLYMSPEQIESPKGVDARTDVWALGAILYKLLTGRAAFAAETASASLVKIVRDPPPPLRAHRMDVPPELEALVMRCLEKDVRRRVQGADELARALAPFAGLTPAERTASGASYSQPRPQVAARRPLTMIAVGVATMLAAGAAIWFVGSRARATPASRLVTDATTAATSAATPARVTTGASPSAAVDRARDGDSTPKVPATVASATAAPPPSAPSAPSAPPATSTSAAPARPGGPAKAPSSRGAPSDAFSDRL